MSIFKRLALLGVMSGLLILSAFAHAQEFPNRPITLVVPFPAGSVTDGTARTIGQSISEALGQPVVVENRAGGQGTLGAAIVAQSKPDGYTLLAGSSVMFVAKSLYKRLPYDPDTAFVPVSGVGSTAMIFMVANDSPIQSIADLTKAVRAAKPPVTVGFGSPSGQVALALFSTVTQSNPVPVSYRGIPQALTDLTGGHIQAAIVDIGSGVAQIKGGKLRAIAISAASRYVGLSEVPTLEEAFPGASGALETIIALQAPAGTPKWIVDRLDKAVRDGLAKPDVQARLAALNITVLPLSSPQTADRIKTDNPRWEAFIRKAGIEQE